MLNYTKLWILLENRGMKKTDLKEVISGSTLAKLGKNETISSDIIEKLCKFLKCQPGDIMEYIDDEQMKEVEEKFDEMTKAMAEQLKALGIGEEQFATMMQEALGGAINSMFNGGKSIGEINQNIVDKHLKKD